MAETQETHEKSEEYPEPTRDTVAQRLDAIEQWQRGHRIQLEKTQALLTEVRDAVRPAPERDRDPLSAAGMLAEVLDHVREAAPLLQSRAVRAMRAGGSVLDYLKAGRS